MTRRIPRHPTRRRDPKPPHISIPSLGTTIRWIREERSLTREAAAHTLNLSTSQLRRFERDVTVPPMKTLKAIIDGYGLDQAMIAHLHDLVVPPVPLTPPDALRRYTLADTTLALNLSRFQVRGVPAAYIDPVGNVLSRNDLFADAYIGIDLTESLPVWMFSRHGRDVLIDYENECRWTIASLKRAMGRHRDSDQAKDIVTALSPISEAQRLWADSLSVTHGRDSRCLMHLRDRTGTPVSYQLALTEGIAAYNILLFTATPEICCPPTKPE